MDSDGLDVGHPLRGNPRDALLLHAYQGPISEVQKEKRGETTGKTDERRSQSHQNQVQEEEPGQEQIAPRGGGGIPRRV